MTAVLPMPTSASVPTELLIGSQWRAASSGDLFAVEDPATGEVIAQVADGGEADAIAALDAAADAQHAWATLASRDRSDILRRAFQALIARTGEFAALIHREMGKSLPEARDEVGYSAEFLRWFSEEAVRTYGRYAPSPDGRSRVLVTKQPVGPSLLITPWNFPLAMAARKVGAALAAGCTAILKPADLTPLTAALFASVLQDAGLPVGVLNLVQTTRPDEVTRALMADGRLRKVSFTGSTPVGRHILAGAADGVLRTSMELGGNAPFIVFDDADLDLAVAGAVVAKLRNTGQACTAANRFLVHESVVDTFAARLTERMRELPVGPGSHAETYLGPLINQAARVKVQQLVDDAVAGGALLLTGGTPEPGPGYYYPATVLRGVPVGARMQREEIFGPVAAVGTFSDERDAVARANDTEYGLVAYVYTRDLDRGLRMSEQLETGMLGINTGSVANPAAPFGGVKQSGLGREGGAEGIEEYLTTRYIGIAAPDPHRPPL